MYAGRYENFGDRHSEDGWTNDPLGAQQYLEATGDADGVVQEDGKPLASVTSQR